jgi:hypothetical protein
MALIVRIDITGSFATVAQNTPGSSHLHASSSPASFSVRALSTLAASHELDKQRDGTLDGDLRLRE